MPFRWSLGSPENFALQIADATNFYITEKVCSSAKLLYPRGGYKGLKCTLTSACVLVILHRIAATLRTGRSFV